MFAARTNKNVLLFGACFSSLMLAATAVFGQGTFIYDQQSANETVAGETPVIIQPNQPVGQSFTPTLSFVGFARFYLYDPNPGNSVGATVYVNLRANSISGSILATTTPVFMPDGFSGHTDFFFSSPATVVPGTTYYFQPVVQSGDQSWTMTAGHFNYAGGTAYYQGVPLSNNEDLWFREGVYVVPEPSSLALLIGSGVLFYVRRKNK